MIKRPRGTRDLFDEDVLYFNKIVETVKSVVKNYNIGEIRLPMFEEVELYKRGTGETTDVVTKEIYQFEDRGGRSLALRPEGTAGVMRSYIENKLYGDYSQTTKQFYISEFFRYERPQNGRQRQFHQFGVEYLNINSNNAIIEIFLQINDILSSLNLGDIKFTINNLGTSEERETYKKHLVSYLSTFTNEMCEDCKTRLETNPLRILDCKVDGEKEFVMNSPLISEFYGEETEKEFTLLKNALDKFNISFEINPKMVRGLDYYSNIIFEVDSESNTLLGGGCYNNLFEQLGGSKQVNCVGYAIGLERLINYLKEKEYKIESVEKSVYLLDKVRNEDSNLYLLDIAHKLRNENIKVEFDLLNKSMKSLFKYTNQFSGDVLVINRNNLEEDTITIFENGKPNEISLKKYLEKVKNV